MCLRSFVVFSVGVSFSGLLALFVVLAYQILEQSLRPINAGAIPVVV